MKSAKQRQQFNQSSNTSNLRPRDSQTRKRSSNYFTDSHSSANSSSKSSCHDGDDQNLNLPFFAWQCISISMKDGYDVNLIIKDEESMKIFVQFLILKLQSFDGIRGTFEYIRKASRKNKHQTDKQIMRRVYNRYLLMKV